MAKHHRQITESMKLQTHSGIFQDVCLCLKSFILLSSCCVGPRKQQKVHILLGNKRNVCWMSENVTWLKVQCLTCPSLGDQFAGTSCNCVHHAQEKSPVNFEFWHFEGRRSPDTGGAGLLYVQAL